MVQIIMFVYALIIYIFLFLVVTSSSMSFFYTIFKISNSSYTQYFITFE